MRAPTMIVLVLASMTLAACGSTEHKTVVVAPPAGGGSMLLPPTDAGYYQDLLYHLEPGKPLGAAAWSWPDRPGVAGCASTPDAVWVMAARAGNVQNLPMAADGSFSGKPEIMMEGEEGFGRMSGFDLVNPRLGVAGTVNKDGGKPVSSDDRAIVLIVQQGGGSGGPD